MPNNVEFRGKIATFGILALLLIFATPVRADNISISLDTASTTLRGYGSHLKSTNKLAVSNNNEYGFSVSMYARNSALINSQDSSYKIRTVLGQNKYLGANQWGYNINRDNNLFNEVPESSYNATTLVDVSRYDKDICDNVFYCTIPITFGVNIDASRNASGYYSTSLVYTAVSKPRPYIPPRPEPGPEPDPDPYVPPKPKYTTNGCKGNMSVSAYGDNCTISKDSMVNASWFRYSGWQANSSEFDYGRGKWATALSIYAIGHNVGDNVSMNSAFAYVPRFSINDNYIRFCNDSFSSGCGDEDVSDVFSSAGKSYGFWIPLASLGCDNATLPSRLDLSNSNVDNSYYAKELAEELIKALGSPCPE